MLGASHDISNVLAVYPSILHCLGVAAGIERSILAATSAKPKRTGSTWTGFPSTLLLQLFFDCKINDRIRTEEASLMFQLQYFFPPWHSAKLSVLHLMSVCMCAFVCGAESQKWRLACLYESSFSAFSVSECGSVLTAYNCTYKHTHTHTVHTASISTPTHAPPTHSLTHPAYWSVTIETERLPNRGGDGDSRREEEVYLPLFFHAKHELMNQSVTQ